MKKSLRTALLLISISGMTLHAIDINKKSVVVNKSIVYTTLTTLKGLRLEGKEGGMKSNNKSFSLPIFKSKTNVAIYSLVEQADGKILVGGNFDSVNNHRIKDIVRLNSNGTIDKTFMSQNSGFNGEVYDIEVLKDNTILVGGYFTELGKEAISNGLIKLNSNGSINQLYDNLNSYDVSVVNDIEVVNNKIFLAGSFIRLYNGRVEERALLALSKFGSLDNIFNKKVNNIEGSAFSIASQKNSLIIGGSFTVKGNKSLTNILKMNINGQIDTKFSLPKVEGFIFDVKYIKNTLFVGGDFIIHSKGKLFENIFKYQNEKLMPISLPNITHVYDINTLKI